MKRIAIVTRKMMIGGIEKSLIAMLDNIDYSQFEVDLYIEEIGGELYSFINDRVNIIYIYKNHISIGNQFLSNLKKMNIKSCLNFLSIGFLLKYAPNDYIKYKSKLKLVKPYDKQYDLAIAYHNPISFSTMFCIDKLKARKKAMWVHSDINEYLDKVDTHSKYYYQYDQIFCVSQTCLNTFIHRYKDLEDKCQVYYNSINKKLILSLYRAEENKKLWTDTKIKVLTISRLSFEKGVDFIPQVANLLKINNINFEWLIIGEGLEYKRLKEQIMKLNLEDYVRLVGKQLNPYQYMKDCDIYVQPSRFEAYGLTIAEAKCFELPIVTTRTQGALEQIQNKVSGILCDIDHVSLYKGLMVLIENPNERQRYTDNLKKEEIDTLSEIQKLYHLV